MLARALIALLLMMNIGAALWLWLAPAPEPAKKTVTATGSAPVLILLSEEEFQNGIEVDTAAEPDSPPEPVAELDQLLCLEVGPFLTQSDLRRVMNAYTASAERLQFRETRALVSRGYWVYIPAQPSRDTALATARELAGKGLRDYYVVTAGERENTISLGLFRELANAQRRHEEVKQMGFNAELQPRSDEVAHYWIDLAVRADEDWRTRIAALTGITAKPVPCQ